MKTTVGQNEKVSGNQNARKIAAKPIATEWGQLCASFNDKLSTGEKINSGSIVMGQHAGTCTIQHEGKKHEFAIIHDFGASIVIESMGREFRLNLEQLVNHAVDAGMLNPDLVFEPDYKTV